jgi:hypothetical protein
MKKITILIAIMITSLSFAQSIEGTWKLSLTDGLWVGSARKGTEGATKYWPPVAGDLPGQRPCQWDDEFVFNADGTFQNVLQTGTWLETWQAAKEGCGEPLAPHNGSNPATYVYSATNGTLVLNGLGAFMGLPKAINGSEINLPANAASTITYLATLTETNLKLDILVGPAGGNWWSFEFTRKLQGQPVLGALNIPTATVGDAPFELTQPESDSPGSFSYTSSNPAVATISGNIVTVVGAGKSSITANQAASGSFLAGSISTNLLVGVADPEVGPTNPIERNAWDVKSIYNGTAMPVSPQYTNVPDVSFESFDGSTIIGATTLGDGNTVNKYLFHLYSGIKVGAVSADVSAMTMLHMDVYSPDFTTFAVKLEDVNKGAKEIGVSSAKVKGSWNSYDIDLSTYTGVDLTKLKFIVPVSYEGSGTQLYIDNVYFYRPATTLGVSKFDTSGIKMYPNPVKNTLTIDANSAIQRVSVYNVLGQEVMKASPKSNSVILQTNQLQKGVYMVKTEIDGKISTSKVVKE